MRSDFKNTVYSSRQHDRQLTRKSIPISMTHCFSLECCTKTHIDDLWFALLFLCRNFCLPMLFRCVLSTFYIRYRAYTIYFIWYISWTRTQRLLKACPHWQQIVAENGNKLLRKTATNRQQIVAFRQQIVAVFGNNLLPFLATICCRNRQQIVASGQCGQAFRLHSQWHEYQSYSYYELLVRARQARKIILRLQLHITRTSIIHF